MSIVLSGVADEAGGERLFPLCTVLEPRWEMPEALAPIKRLEVGVDRLRRDSQG